MRDEANVRYIAYIAMLAFLCLMTGACADKNKPTSRPLSARERQEAALRDPFTYGPSQQDGMMMDDPNISGGGLSEFDRDGFRKDVDRVFNP